ncbi:MAG: VOC family protein [Pseudomonadota bacterium]
MPEIIPNLWFDGQAEEAARFYAGLFPNSQVDHIMHAPSDKPGASPGTVLYVEFTLNGQRYGAINGGPTFTLSEAISLVVACQDQAEIDHYWDALGADGGTHSQCGWLKDRFGLSWQIQPAHMQRLVAGPSAEGSARAFQAMLGMTKLDISELEAAYAGPR